MTKTFALVAFTMALAKDLAATNDDRVKWRAEHLLKAANNAANKYPSPDINKGQLKQITKAVLELDKVEITADRQKNLVPILSLILCGVDEILAHTRNQLTRELFIELEKKLMWMNSLVDPKLDRIGDYIRGEHHYNRWVNAKQ